MLKTYMYLPFFVIKKIADVSLVLELQLRNA